MPALHEKCRPQKFDECRNSNFSQLRDSKIWWRDRSVTICP
jgi:hypothetical protein